jgi:hypothetical protein
MDSYERKRTILSVGLPFLCLLLVIIVGLACRLPTPDQYWEMSDKQLEEYMQGTDLATPLPSQQYQGTATLTVEMEETDLVTPLVSQQYQGTATSFVEEEFFRVSSQGGADTGATAPTIFTIDESWLVTLIGTYHWNNGQGVAVPGTIGLQAADGTTYGPWGATGSPGQGGVVNAYWVVNPQIVIPSGTYTVLDSDPSTWAQSATTGGAGMSWGTGIRQGNP